MLEQRAVDGKSNEITAIPELLDMLDVRGAIVSIDAMGTQKAIAAKIVGKGADYVLALKGNQTSLHDDALLFFADPVLAAACAQAEETDAGHGRIEERLCRIADAGWLAERHPQWKDLRSLAAITERRIDKRSGKENRKTRLFISSLEPDPKAILDAVRSHWGVENNLHWTLDVIFDEDRCKTRKDNSPGHRGQSPAPGSHRTWRADFPHHALRQLVHSTASICSFPYGRRSFGFGNGVRCLIWWKASQVRPRPAQLRLHNIFHQ